METMVGPCWAHMESVLTERALGVSSLQLRNTASQRALQGPSLSSGVRAAVIVYLDLQDHDPVTQQMPVRQS